VSGERRASHRDEARDGGPRPANDVVPQSEPGEPLWSPPIGSGEIPEALRPDQPGTFQELNDRLREQAAENAKLDADLRYLLEELAIRKEFIADLEHQLESARWRDGQHHEVIAEFAAYRQRFSHRTVDRLVVRVQRLPWLYRALEVFRRAVIGRVSGRAAPSASSSPAGHPGGDGRDADLPSPSSESSP
jgi:uncharacterized coiled-coil protein SlyX